MNNSVKPLAYLPGLDGIRALAALLVISTHWPNTLLGLRFGWIGVNIFFVLSGFLITRILVNQKENDLKTYFRSFFVKRALRIFPVYYMFLLLVCLAILAVYWWVPSLRQDSNLVAGKNAVTNDIWYYLTYTYNIKINLRHWLNLPDGSNRFIGHLWSLCAEEQFYLIFPFVVYFLNISTLKRVLITIILICPLIRLCAAIWTAPIVTDRYWLGELLYTNTLCQADALAMGAALAVFKFNFRFPYRNFLVIATIWLAVGIYCFYFLRRAGYFLVEGKSLGYDFPGFWFDEKTPHFLINIRAAYQYTLVNALAFFLIAPATTNKPLFPSLMLWRPLAYLGRISYGVYLLHNPLLAFLMLAASAFGGWFKITANPAAEVTIFALYLTLLVGLAHLSYRYFELKIMHRYKHLAYA